MAAQRFVVSLSDLPEDSDVGEKANNLAKLQRNGIDVPETLVILDKAYHHFVKHNSLDKKIKHILGALDLQNIGHVNKAYDYISKYLDESKIPDELLMEIIREYKKLGVTLEDAKIKIMFSNFNFPSQEAKGDSSLVHEIKNRWKSIYSLFNPKGNPTIIIQRQVKGKHGKIRTSSMKFKADEVLTKDEINKIEELAKKVKGIFYFPQEIDFSFEKGKLYVHSVYPEPHPVDDKLRFAELGYKIIKNSHIFN